MSHDNPVKVDPEIMHGTPCFSGTRVPVKSLFDHLAHGYGIDYFVYQFPTVDREQVLAVLDVAGQLVSSTPAPDRQIA
jgi:uncharacterized protein (DUF433 family)